MRILLLLILFLTTKFSVGQKTEDYLISFNDTTTGEELIGYKDRNGEIVISAKFTRVNTDTFYSLAIVQKQSDWIGIDRNEKIVLQPFIFDNGPDYINEGLFRFVENNKIGFADIDGEKIILAKYDFATIFENGIAAYTLGGYREYDKDKEHRSWKGGYENGFINKTGIEFTKVSRLKNSKREAWTKDKKHFLLNKNGEIIKQLKR